MKTKKTTAKKKATKAANDAPPLPPSMPGQQEHIPETLTEVIPSLQKAAMELDEAKKAAAGWGRQCQSRLAVLQSQLKEYKIGGVYYDGVVRVSVSVTDPKEKIEIEVVDAHLPEAAE